MSARAGRAPRPPELTTPVPTESTSDLSASDQPTSDLSASDQPASDLSASDLAALLEKRIARIRRRLERLIGIAATEGNALIPLRNGDEIFAAMLDASRSERVA